MSRLEELLSELCPNGVRILPLKEVTSAVNIGINPRKFFKLNPEGAEGFYVTVRELNGLLGVKQYEKTDLIDLNAVKIINERANIEKDDILFSNTGTVGKMALVLETPENWGVNEGIYVIKPLKDTIEPKFLYYYLSSNKAYMEYASKFTGSTLKHVTQAALLSLSIPVPPLDVQREIVRILDNFTELTAELTVELTARKKQYEYYRDELLYSGEESYLELGKVATLVTGATPSKVKREYWENGSIPWMSSGEVNFKRIYSTENYITQRGYDSASTTLVPIHSVVIALAGQGKTRGKVAITEIELCTNQSLCSIICGERLNYKYLYYYLDSRYEELRSISNGDGTRGGLSLRILNPYKIPVPSLNEQERIVSILDRFDTLCNDISSGLPAEIEARQKQYEYYRDKLLTFKELA